MKKEKQEIQKGLNWLKNEFRKDQTEINVSKTRIINEIRSIDKTKMFKKEEKVEEVEMSFWDRLSIVLGHGKKR